MGSPQKGPSEFDEFAANYDDALNQGLALSGETKDYFIERRLHWFKRCLAHLRGSGVVESVLDYGCGAGASFPYFRDILGATTVSGIDVSEAELAIARKDFPWAAAYTPDEIPAIMEADVAYSNGTFHHIPPSLRPSCLEMIHRNLKPGGIFALWENNPWNPGTRWIMSRVPFDRDAITLTPPETRRLVRAAGFEVVRTDFLFIFPRMLSPLRAVEPLVSRLPLGGQYQVLCRKA